MLKKESKNKRNEILFYLELFLIWKKGRKRKFVEIVTENYRIATTENAKKKIVERWIFFGGFFHIKKTKRKVFTQKRKKNGKKAFDKLAVRLRIYEYNL